MPVTLVEQMGWILDRDSTRGNKVVISFMYLRLAQVYEGGGAAVPGG